MPWRLADLPDQTGRRWLVTGATNGLGEATAHAAAEAGATLILAARDTERAARIAAEWGQGHEIVHLDLANLDTVRRAAEAISGDIDVLVNNAGTITRSREETDDGFERMLGVNYLGPFAFTNLLLRQVRDRVVIVASEAHRAGVLHHRDPHFRRRKWGIAAAYNQSKLANMVWGLALWRRLRGTGVGVQLVHPGWVQSNLYSAIGSPRLERAAAVLTKPLAHPPEEGALTTLFAATQTIPDCSYVGPDGMGSLRGDPALIGRSGLASNPREAEWAWNFAVRETGADLP